MDNNENKPGLGRRLSARIAVIGATLAAVSVLAGATAFASAPTDPAGVITPAATELKTDLLAVAAAVALLGIVILGVRKGWQLMKRFF